MYKQDPGYFKDTQNFIGAFFSLCYQPEFYNNKTRVFDFTKVDAKLKELIRAKKLPASALNDLSFNINYSQPVITLKELKNLLNKKFLVLEKMQDDSNPAMKVRWSAILKPKK